MIVLTATIQLKDGETYEIDKRNMLSLETNIIDRADISLPSWGIISNSGSLRFVDYNGDIREYAEQLRLTDNIEVRVWLKNTTSKSEKEIAHFFTSQWDYDSNNYNVNVTINDNLEEWQDINIDGFSYDARETEAKNLKYFYEYLYSKTPLHYNMIDFSDLDKKTQYVLENTSVKYPLLKKGTLWQQWEKLAVASQSHIFYQYNKTVFVYNEAD